MADHLLGGLREAATLTIDFKAFERSSVGRVNTAVWAPLQI